MTSVSSELASMSLYTAQVTSEDTLTGSASEDLDQSDFLTLLTEQLQYQDPMDPQDNSEMVSQMCAFSQLNVTTDIDSTLTDFAGFMKANSLVGQEVTVSDTTTVVTTTTTNGKTTTSTTTTFVTGTVSSAYADGSSSGITINGTTYAVDDLLYTYGTATSE